MKQKLLKIARRVGRVVAIPLVILVVVYWWNTRPLPGPMGEVIGPDEDLYIGQLINASMALANMDHDIRRKTLNDDTYRRDVHGKTPGCVKATFEVLPRLLPAYQYGLFAKPGKYEAWLRFSNGNHRLQADYLPDVRGLALKVMGVPGRKLLEPEADAPTQDFILMNNPTYFFRDLKEYADFSSMLTRRSGALGDIFPFFRYSWNPFHWNLRSMFGAGKANKPPPTSPLHTRYWSASAYQLGTNQYVKYSVQPKSCDPSKPLPSSPWRAFEDNFLRTNLQKTLANGTWCFDFMIQLQAPGKNMPVEDATIEWSEKDSPFVTVAKVTVLKNGKEETDQDDPFQDPLTKGWNPWACFCEALAFNPWHSLPEHRPVGAFNRLRKAVYLEGARFRRDKMRATHAEPANWSLSLTTRDCAGPLAASGQQPGQTP